MPQSIGLAESKIWSVDIDGAVSLNPALQASIASILESGPCNSLAYGSQTASILQRQDDAPWPEFFDQVRAAIGAISEQEGAGLDEGAVAIRAWGSVLESDDTHRRDFAANRLHDHAPAWLSAVYCVSDGGAEGSGTQFVAPIADPFRARPRTLVAKSIPGRLLVFAGDLVHMPYFEGEARMTGPRCMIGMDFHYTPDEMGA